MRDGTGWLVRIYANPLGYIDNIPLRNSIYGLNYLDTRAQLLGAESVLEAAAIDKYRYLRNAYLKARRYQVYDGKPPPEEEEE